VKKNSSGNTLPDPLPAEQGCQIFYVAYGQNSNEKWPKWLFFEKVMAKHTKCFKTMVIYIGDSKC